MQPININEALAFCGYPEGSNVIDTSKYPAAHREALQAVADLFIMHEAYNDRQIADYNDYDQKKYIIIWDLDKDDNNPSGFRFYDSGYVRTNTDTIGGPRLCFLNESDIQHALEHHMELYRKVNTWVAEQKAKTE